MKTILLTLLTLAFTLNTNAQIITTIAGAGYAGFSGDGGQATNAELSNPTRIALDGMGNIYIADGVNMRIRIVSTTGIINTIAGNGTQGYSGDGGQATFTELNQPSGVVFDASGNLYIADAGNNRIRMVNTLGIISTIAGNGTQGYSGDGGQAVNAELYEPGAITIDAAGNLYIADAGNNRIRMVNISGVITTIAGNGTQGYSGDGGQATNAELYNPSGVAVDNSANLYISDGQNNRIRMINNLGIINTIAGNGTAAYSGDGGQATLAEVSHPKGLAFDAIGNLYIADYFNNRIRLVNTLGIISTIAGNGCGGSGIGCYSGDGGQATNAGLNNPCGIVFDSMGNLYIADAANNVIRMITNVGQTTAIKQTANNNEPNIYPNPNNGLFNLTIRQFDNLKMNHIEIYNVTGECVHRQIATSANCQIDLSSLNEGVYNISLQSNEGVVNKRVVIVR